MVPKHLRVPGTGIRVARTYFDGSGDRPKGVLVRNIIKLISSLNKIDPLATLDERTVNGRLFCLDGGSPAVRHLLSEMVRRRLIDSHPELRTLDERDTMAALGWLAALTPGQQVGPDKLGIGSRALLELARQAELVERVVEPALNQTTGAVLLIDRSLWHTLASEGFADGFPLDMMSSLLAHIFTLGLPEQSYLLFNDSPSESAADGHRQLTRDAYQTLAQRFPERIQLVPTSAGLEQMSIVLAEDITNRLRSA